MAQFIDENGMKWPQVYDEDRSLYRAFGVDGFPRYFVLSNDGIILNEFKGWKQNEKDDITSAIERALASEQTAPNSSSPLPPSRSQN